MKKFSIITLLILSLSSSAYAYGNGCYDSRNPACSNYKWQPGMIVPIPSARPNYIYNVPVSPYSPYGAKLRTK